MCGYLRPTQANDAWAGYRYRFFGGACALEPGEIAMLLTPAGLRRSIPAIALFLLTMPPLCLAAANLMVNSKPAPNRGGQFGYFCPPNFDENTGKSQDFNTDINGKPQNYGDDVKRMLYYGGETSLVLTANDGSKTDLKVVEWCIKRPAKPNPNNKTKFIAGDFWTYEIFTSMNGVETQQVPPGTPC